MDNKNVEQPDDENNSVENISRRKFFRISAATAGVAAVGGAAGWVNHRVHGVPYDDFPVEIKHNELKPMDQRNLIFSYAASPQQQRKFPEREKAFAAAINEPGFKFRQVIGILKANSKADPERWDNSRLG